MDESPFRIAVFGDLLGDARGTAPPLAERRPVFVDRDNFDEVLARFEPRLRLPLAEGGPEVEIAFRDIDDFRPEALYRLDLFAKLRTLRKRLDDPETFADAAAELGAASEPAPAAPAAAPAVSTEGLLDSILDQGENAARSGGLRQGDDLQDFINRSMASSLAPKLDPKQPEYVAEVDRAAAEQMRCLLHHPRYQALEALWHGIFLLTRRIETSVDLKLFLIDATKRELVADLLENEDLRGSAVYRRVVAETVQTPGADPWGVLIGAYRFGADPDDAKLLAMLGGVAGAADAPWIAEADPCLLGCRSLAETPDPATWARDPDPIFAALRKFPEAANIGLVAGRWLAREPYGRDSDPCESFAFEELEGSVTGEQLVWGPPAFVAAQLLAVSFSRLGWNMQPVVRDLDRLPLHAYRQDGESRLQPSGEALLTERGIERIHDRGLMALSAVKDSDTVRLVRFQSIADPLKPLASRWG